MADGLKINLKETSLLKNAEGTSHEIKGKDTYGASFSWRSPIVLIVDVSISQTILDFYVFLRGTGGVRLDWGDGTTSVINTQAGSLHSHTYPTSTGTYSLTVSPLSKDAGCFVKSNSNSIIEIKSLGSLTIIGNLSEVSKIGSVNLVSAPKSISTTIRYLNSVFNTGLGNGSSAFNDVNVTYWDVSKAELLSGTFEYCSSFNQNISGWDTSSLVYLDNCFRRASSFNQNISTWDTSKVIGMREVFEEASSFNQDLSSWSIKNVTRMEDLFSLSGMSTENYSRTLIGWANSHNAGNAKNNVSLGAVSITYNNTTYTTGNQFNNAASARAYLVGTAGWTITDGGQV